MEYYLGSSRVMYLLKFFKDPLGLKIQVYEVIRLSLKL